MRKSIVIALVISSSIIIGFIPFESVTVPKWRIRVVDSYGNAIVKQDLVQSCENYTLSVDPCIDAPDRVLATDKDGLVEFSERSVRMNLWSRIFNSVINFLLIVAHGSYGNDVYVLVSDGPNSNAELRFDPNKPQPQIFTLPTKEQPTK